MTYVKFKTKGAVPVVPEFLSDRYSVTADGCWDWDERDVTKPTVWVSAGGHWVDARRLLYSKLREPLAKDEHLWTLCGNDACIAPLHQKIWERMDGEQRLAAVVSKYVEKKRIDGRRRWLWRQQRAPGTTHGPPRFRVHIDGKRIDIRRWLWIATHTGDPVPAKLVHVNSDCNLLCCVDPSHFGPMDKWTHLFRATNRGYVPDGSTAVSLCHIGIHRRKRKKDGYVPYGKTTLHRARYISIYGPLSPEILLHHLCGQEDCCRPTHLRPADLDEHLSLHGRKRVQAGAEAKAVADVNDAARIEEERIARDAVHRRSLREREVALAAAKATEERLRGEERRKRVRRIREIVEAFASPEELAERRASREGRKRDREDEEKCESAALQSALDRLDEEHF